MVRYLLGHRIHKRFAPGRVYFTIDDSDLQFSTSSDVVAHIRWMRAALDLAV